MFCRKQLTSSLDAFDDSLPMAWLEETKRWPKVSARWTSLRANIKTVLGDCGLRNRDSCACIARFRDFQITYITAGEGWFLEAC